MPGQGGGQGGWGSREKQGGVSGCVSPAGSKNGRPARRYFCPALPCPARPARRCLFPATWAVSPLSPRPASLALPVSVSLLFTLFSACSCFCGLSCLCLFLSCICLIFSAPVFSVFNASFLPLVCLFFCLIVSAPVFSVFNAS